jgi:Kef-type K+ transport system membrane component KefB/nucleotide-binding universal stress UspA family protein
MIRKSGNRFSEKTMLNQSPDYGPVRTRKRTRGLSFAAGLAIATAVVLTATAASAATAPGAAPSGAAAWSPEAIFIAELGLLLLVGRLMGEAARRIGQPPVMGQLIGGVLLGPSLFGWLWPSAQHALFPDNVAQKSMLDAVSQLGILMLLLLTGMETDLALVRRVGRAAITVAIAGIALPFACGFALGEWLPAALLPKPDERLVTAIFLGTALSVSSVNIVAVVVREMNFMRRDIGQIIVASAILEDAVCWVLIAIAFGLASAGTLDVWSLGRAIIGTLAFLAVSLTVGRRLVFRLIRWVNDNFTTEFPVITVILIVMFAMALTTQFIGVRTFLGAFVAGILIGESPILTRHIDEALRGLIVALFMPVFFSLSGLRADLAIFRHGDLALLGIGLILIASIGKFLGAFVGGTIGGLSRAESLALGCGMNARGSSQVIVATMGLSMSVLNQNLFTLIVTMAVVTTLAMPPMLRWALNRLPLRKKERLRLEREELDAKGFVTNLERLLLAADDSANGKLAARVVGAIAGSGDKPTTILDLGEAKSGKKAARPKTPSRKPGHGPAANTDGDGSKGASKDASKAEVEAVAETVTTLETHPDDERSGRADVITRQHDTIDAETIADEARKGYGLLVVGIDKARNPKGGFSKDASRIVEGFEGPVAIVESHPSRADARSGRHGRILVPVNGTEVSRRAVEVALTLARAEDAEIVALYVTRAANSGKRGHGSGPRRRANRRSERAVLADIAALAERYEVKLRTKTKADAAPDEAILSEAKQGYDLVVLGVSRRPGDMLFFGNTATAVLDRSKVSNLFVAS